MNRYIVEVDVSPWADDPWDDRKNSLESGISIALDSYAITTRLKNSLDLKEHVVFTVEDVKEGNVNSSTLAEICKQAQFCNGPSTVHVKAWIISQWVDVKFPAPKEKQ